MYKGLVGCRDTKWGEKSYMVRPLDEGKTEGSPTDEKYKSTAKVELSARK